MHRALCVRRLYRADGCGDASARGGDRPSAFYHCSELCSIPLSSGLRSIGEQAFAHCVQLEEIALPEGVRSLGRNAFPSGGDLMVPTGDNLYAQEYRDLYGLYCVPAEYVRAWRDGRLTFQIDESAVAWLWITDASASTWHKSSSRGSYGAFNAIDLDDSTS